MQPKIFSRERPSFLILEKMILEVDSRQNCIRNISRLVDGEAQRGDYEGFEFFLEWSEIDRIFLRGQKAAGGELAAHGQQALDVFSVISVVVAKLDFCRGGESCRAQLGEELLWPRDSAEHDWSGRHDW